MFEAKILNWRKQNPNNESSYIVYNIDIIYNYELRWNIQKRYSDFLTLDYNIKESIKDVNNKKHMIRLPKKKMFGNFNEKFLYKRLNLLQDYINYIIKNYKNNIHFLKFIDILNFSIKKSSIHINFLSKFVQMGDIILFNTKSLISKVQRTILNTNYDHIGMIIRQPYNSHLDMNLYLLEATTEHGVHKYPLIPRLKSYHDNNSTMVLRKLQNCSTNFDNNHNKELLFKSSSISNPNESADYKDQVFKNNTTATIPIENNISINNNNDKKKLLNFIDSIHGTPYGLRLLPKFYQKKKDKDKIMGGENNNNNNNINQKNLEKKQEYFCSQLVSDCYHIYNIIKYDKNKLYLPMNFSENKESLEYINSNIKLSNEIPIIFNKLSLQHAEKIKYLRK